MWVIYLYSTWTRNPISLLKGLLLMKPDMEAVWDDFCVYLQVSASDTVGWILTGCAHKYLGCRHISTTSKTSLHAVNCVDYYSENRQIHFSLLVLISVIYPSCHISSCFMHNWCFLQYIFSITIFITEVPHFQQSNYCIHSWLQPLITSNNIHLYVFSQINSEEKHWLA